VVGLLLWHTGGHEPGDDRAFHDAHASRHWCETAEQRGRCSWDQEQLPLVAFRLAEEVRNNEFDIAWQLSAERGWMVPAYTLPPNAQDVTIKRALCKETLSREHVETLARDIEQAARPWQRRAEPTSRSAPGWSRGPGTDEGG
jgi:glutamate/tyrosine decarboxylase-like PLP-dependent enzyme